MAEQSRRTGHRLGELSPATRAGVVAVLVAFTLAPFVAGAHALQAGWQATGDVAVIAVRSLDAWTGDAPLVGQPTTGEEFTGRPSNHPGPVEYWILGATERALGPRAGIVLGAALVNALALLGTVWLAHRRGGPALLALVAVALAALVHALGAASLFDPFNSELATYPMLLTLLAAWCVVVGDLRVWPVLAAAATVAAQVHVAGAAFVAPLVLAAVAATIAAARAHRRAVRRERPWLLGAAGIVVVGWLPVVAQELSRGPSNLAALWATATAPRPRIGLAFTAERVATAVAPVPTFVRATGRFGFLHDVGPALVLVAFALIGVLASLAIALRGRNPRSPAARLAVLVLVAMLVSMVASAGQPPLAAFRADGTRWLWVVSLGVWVGVAWSTWQLLPEPARTRAERVVVPSGVAVAALVLVAALATARLADARDGAVMAATDELAGQVLHDLPHGRYHVTFEGNQALVTVGPGIVYRLEAAGDHVVLDDNAFTRGYGASRTDGGPVDGRLVVASGPGGAVAGRELLASVPVDGSDPGAGTIRVYRER